MYWDTASLSALFLLMSLPVFSLSIHPYISINLSLLFTFAYKCPYACVELFAHHGNENAKAPATVVSPQAFTHTHTHVMCRAVMCRKCRLILSGGTHNTLKLPASLMSGQVARVSQTLCTDSMLCVCSDRERLSSRVREYGFKLAIY